MKNIKSGTHNSHIEGESLSLRKLEVVFEYSVVTATVVSSNGVVTRALVVFCEIAAFVVSEISCALLVVKSCPIVVSSDVEFV